MARLNGLLVVLLVITVFAVLFLVREHYVQKYEMVLLRDRIGVLEHTVGDVTRIVKRPRHDHNSN